MGTIPLLQTRRLVLRAPTVQDAPSWQAHFNDYEVIRYLSAQVPWPYPPDGVTSFLTSVVLPSQGKDRWVWGLFLRSNPRELVGCVDLWREGRPEHRGFWLARKLWGRGLMTEAVAPVTDYAFNNLGFERLVFSNAVGNVASRRVKEKTGATFIGTGPAAFVDPAFTQREVWEFTKDDWRVAGSAG
jgi:RimJ/RimL family protein N-acetyltransferase